MQLIKVDVKVQDPLQHNLLFTLQPQLRVQTQKREKAPRTKEATLDLEPESFGKASGKKN